MNNTDNEYRLSPLNFFFLTFEKENSNHHCLIGLNVCQMLPQIFRCFLAMISLKSVNEKCVFVFS